MADNFYDFEAIIAAGTLVVNDDGSGTDSIVINAVHTISAGAIALGNYAVTIFLSAPLPGNPANAYSLLMVTEPGLLYQSFTVTGTVENIYGSAGRESFSGNAVGNLIQGDPLDVAGEHDLMGGLGGNDTLIGAGGSDWIYGGTGNDRLFGDNDPASQSSGGMAHGDDTLYGDEGDDLLIGGLGNNTLDGGTGYDSTTYIDYVDNGNLFYRTEINLELGTATLIAVDLYDVTQYVMAVDTLIGMESFTGTVEADLMIGGTTFVLQDQVRIRFNGEAGADTLVGGAGADALYGGTGDDLLDTGGNGNVDYIADLLVGGAQNDSYRLHVAAEIVELWGEGNDTVVADLSWTLGYNLEDLTLTEAAGTSNATGNILNNTLLGNSFNNVLDGRGGDNTLSGGAGNDTYVLHTDQGLIHETIYETSGTDTIRTDGPMNLLYFTQVENLVLTGTGDFIAVGNLAANSITGNSGANELTNWASNDTLRGAAGNDTYVITDSTTRTIEVAGGGIDNVLAYANLTLSGEVENMTLGFGGLSGTGNVMDNTMTGSTGADVLAGVGGNDTLFGDDGADSLYGGNGNDLLSGDLGDDLLAGGAGVDLVRYDTGSAIHINLAVSVAQNTLLGLDTFTLIENLQTGSGADILRGSGLGNMLTSGSGDDDLFGAAGNDTLYGGSGADTLRADIGNDRLYGGPDADTLVFAGPTPVTVNLTLTTQNTGYGTDLINGIENVTGGSGADHITGNGSVNTLLGMGGADTLEGGANLDWINGGTGTDSLSGGGDTDVFVFGTADGSDTITDFQDGSDSLVMGAFTAVTIQDAGANTVLIYGTTHVTLLNVVHTNITIADFLFA